MKTKIISLSFLFLLILSSIVLVNAQLSLNLTLTSDKTVYDKYDPVNLSGTLQFGAISPNDGLIGIQVKYPTGGNSLILRAIQTGTGTVFNLPEQITSAYSSDLSGHPVSTFFNGANGFFTAIFSNQDHQTHSAIVAISIYDGNGVPLGLSYQPISIGSDATQTETESIPIPTSAHSGIAYGYADVFSDWPQNGGVPIAQEKSFTFSISGGIPASGQGPSTSGNAGTYSMTFTLPKNTQVGIYQVYSSSTYSGIPGAIHVTFNLPGWIGDFNSDGKVDANDLFLFLDAYISYYQGQIFNPACDLNNDGKMDANDFFLFLSAYIQYWSP